ncbi:carboxypeptidase N subunit 2-like isoform X2 [Mya arenaria]|nr:carboxypeptidase N subunit 2-like isoform X2 [Mya arenaria]
MRPLQDFSRLMLVLILPNLASSFVLDSECVAPAPCTCSGSNIQCSSKNLQTVPQFKHINISSNSLINIDLQGNYITTIGPNAFCNLILSTLTTVYMQLYLNHMNSMSSSAFNCIGANIFRLNMDVNNFSVLPQALKSLVNLAELDIDTNPLTSLDSAVMSVIGRTLKTLHVDLSYFTTWPHEFRLLRTLNTLSISHIRFPKLSTDAFHGMESTLRTLTIADSRLERMPIAICHIQNLRSLTFTSNHYLNLNTTVFDPCNKRFNYITTLDISGNELRNFPDIFHIFPEITILNLQENKLGYIDGDLIPANNRLQSLYLSFNNFSRIPDVVNKLHSLTRLEMQYNHIGAIYDTDLQNLTALTRLVLFNNGLQSISSHAFRNNPKLNYLDLDDNLLHTISSSITTLHSLSTLYLRNNHIECTCDLSHLKSWNVTSINSFTGNCDSSTETLKHFLANALPGCPKN